MRASRISAGGRGELYSVALVAVGILVVAVWVWAAFGGWGVRIFCGDYPTQSCLDQMSLFALASLIPGVLALLLFILAFALPSLRERSDLRAQTLGYSLVAWIIAGFTVVLGGLPAI